MAISPKPLDRLKAVSLSVTDGFKPVLAGAAWGRTLVLGACMGVLVFALLAYGAVHPWSYYPLSLTVAGISLVLLARSWHLARTGTAPLVWGPRPPLWPGLAAVALLALFQITPLPAGLAGVLSPEAAAIRGLGNGYGLGPFLPLSLNPYATTLEFLKLWPAVGFFFILLYTVQSRRQMEALVKVIVGTALFEALYGLWHFRNHLTRGWRQAYAGTRLNSTLINSDHLAAYLTLAILLGFGLFLANRETVPQPPSGLSARRRLLHWSRSEYLEPQSRRYLLLFILLLLTVALIFTGSRGGMLSLVVGFAFMALLIVGRKWRKGHFFFLAGFLLTATIYSLWLGSAPFLQRFLDLNDQIRYQAFQGALAIFREFPLWGSGLGTFGELFYRYEPASFRGSRFVYTHSEWLQVLAETGLVGFALVVGLWLAFFSRLLSQWQRRQDGFARGLGLGGLAALAAGAFHAAGEFPFRIPAFTLAYAATAAITYLAVHHHQDPLERFSYPRFTASASPRRTTAIFAGLIVLQLCLMMQAGLFWQAERLAPTEIDTTRLRGPVALEDWRRALAFNPQNSRYYLGLAQALQQQGRPDSQTLEEGEGLLRQAIRRDPAHWRYHEALAEFYLTWYERRPDRFLPRAVKELDAAVRLFPDRASLHLRLGVVLNWMARWRPGLIPASLKENGDFHLEEALRLDPTLKKYLNTPRG